MHKLRLQAQAYECKRVLSVKQSLPDVGCVGERIGGGSDDLRGFA
jgi:hypothetical protein